LHGFGAKLREEAARGRFGRFDHIAKRHTRWTDAWIRRNVNDADAADDSEDRIDMSRDKVRE
jgi:hypothetical protein